MNPRDVARRRGRRGAKRAEEPSVRGWRAIPINDARGLDRAGASPRHHHAWDVAGRNRVPPAYAISPSDRRPRRGATPEAASRRRQPILLNATSASPTAISTKAAPAPAHPDQTRNESTVSHSVTLRATVEEGRCLSRRGRTGSCQRRSIRKRPGPSRSGRRPRPRCFAVQAGLR